MAWFFCFENFYEAGFSAYGIARCVTHLYVQNFYHQHSLTKIYHHSLQSNNHQDPENKFV